VAQTSPTRGLHCEAIGLRDVLFQSITHMAPAASVPSPSSRAPTSPLAPCPAGDLRPDRL